MKLPANEELVLPEIKGNAMEILAEIDPKNSEMIELNVLRSPGKEEYTRIAFYKNKGYNKGREYAAGARRINLNYSLVSIESSYSTTLPDVRTRAPETAPVILNENENLELRIFIDKSIVEVFVNGKQCVAMRIYPGREDSLGVSLRSQGQDAELKSLVAYQMKSIYN
jgi:beta-fructofuranosidase